MGYKGWGIHFEYLAQDNLSYIILIYTCLKIIIIIKTILHYLRNAAILWLLISWHFKITLAGFQFNSQTWNSNIKCAKKIWKVKMYLLFLEKNSEIR